tara:strand:+ start:11456 stop:11623 length:168 start_codon:yes stop_codon:yes gene_type:complete
MLTIATIINVLMMESEKRGWLMKRFLTAPRGVPWLYSVMLAFPAEWTSENQSRFD